MTAPALGHGPELDAVLDRLVDEFAGVRSRPAVAAEVEAADRELRGQVPKGAIPEMVHRLVAARLGVDETQD